MICLLPDIVKCEWGELTASWSCVLSCRLRADSQCPPLPPSCDLRSVRSARSCRFPPKAPSPFASIAPEEAYQLLFGEDFDTPFNASVAAEQQQRPPLGGQAQRPAHFPPSARHGTFLRITERELLALVGRFGIGVGEGSREVGARASIEGFRRRSAIAYFGGSSAGGAADEQQ